MTLDELREIPAYQTRALGLDAQKDPRIMIYVSSVLDKFYQGDWGEKYPEDAQANRMTLESGYGRIVASYDGLDCMEDDLFVIAYIDKDHPGELDYNNIMVMYRSDY